MAELYGDTLDNIAKGYFVFASQLDFVFNIAQASKNLTRYSKELPLGSLTKLGPYSGWRPIGYTGRDIIEICDNIGKTSKFHLRSSVVNTELGCDLVRGVYDLENRLSRSEEIGFYDGMDAEVIHVQIIEKAAMQNGGDPSVAPANIPYTLGGTINSNVMFVPSLEHPLVDTMGNGATKTSFDSPGVVVQQDNPSRNLFQDISETGHSSKDFQPMRKAASGDVAKVAKEMVKVMTK